MQRFADDEHTNAHAHKHTYMCTRTHNNTQITYIPTQEICWMKLHTAPVRTWALRSRFPFPGRRPRPLTQLLVAPLVPVEPELVTPTRV